MDLSSMSSSPGKSECRSIASGAGVMPESQQYPPGSVAARIQASASGLVRQSILRAPANSTTKTLASSAPDAGKSGSASSSAGPSQSTPSSLSSNAQSSSTHSSAESMSEPTDWGSFRSRLRYEDNNGNTDQLDFDDFVSPHSGLSLTAPHWWSGRGEDNRSANGKLELNVHLLKSNILPRAALRQTIYGCPTSVTKAAGLLNDDTDGSAVVALLSDPEFSVDEDPSESLGFTPEHDSNFRTKNSQDGTRTALSLNQVSTINPLDLLPDFRSPPVDGSTTRSKKLPATMSNSPEGHMYDETQLQMHGDCLQPWLNMLNRYRDEVWGDMLPLVQEALQEAKTVKERIPEDQPATRRLRMLLKHFG